MLNPLKPHRSVRAQALHYLARPHTGIPTEPVVSPAAWTQDDVADPRSWTYHLDEADIAAIERELRETRDIPLEELRPGDLPLRRLSKRIESWRHALCKGRGFLRIRGVPVQRWALPDTERFYWALGQHLGTPGAQNGGGDLLGHVRDLRLGREGEVRQYMTAEAIGFHCDAADVVGLLCLRPAREGGRSRIASSVSVFNAIVQQRPDLAPLLFEPMYVDARGDGRTDAFLTRPAAFHSGRLRTFYHGEYLRTATRYPGVEALTPARKELLDLYDALAGSEALCLEMDLQPGDIQLISNHTVVHARTGYVDHDVPEQRRHLLRLWLTLESPGSLRERWLRARALAELLVPLARRTLLQRHL